MNILHDLLQRQVKKHFSDEVSDPQFQKFLTEISETYRWYERDKALSDHAYAISEKEYQSVLENLKSNNTLISTSIQNIIDQVE